MSSPKLGQTMSPDDVDAAVALANLAREHGSVRILDGNGDTMLTVVSHLEPIIDASAEEERSAIIEYLQERERNPQSPVAEDELRSAWQAIERGEHRR